MADQGDTSEFEGEDLQGVEGFDGEAFDVEPEQPEHGLSGEQLEGLAEVVQAQVDARMAPYEAQGELEQAAAGVLERHPELADPATADAVMRAAAVAAEAAGIPEELAGHPSWVEQTFEAQLATQRAAHDEIRERLLSPFGAADRGSGALPFGNGASPPSTGDQARKETAEEAFVRTVVRPGQGSSCLPFQ